MQQQSQTKHRKQGQQRECGCASSGTVRVEPVAPDHCQTERQQQREERHGRWIAVDSQTADGKRQDTHDCVQHASAV